MAGKNQKRKSSSYFSQKRFKNYCWLGGEGEKQDLQAHVLKVAHHGSPTSSSLYFLQTVQPEIAIISYGKNNRYGFPDAEVLANLQKFAKQILTTTQQGDIKIVSDGEMFNVED